MALILALCLCALADHSTYNGWNEVSIKGALRVCLASRGTHLPAVRHSSDVDHDQHIIPYSVLVAVVVVTVHRFILTCRC
jgi:hypothetical protein